MTGPARATSVNRAPVGIHHLQSTIAEYIDVALRDGSQMKTFANLIVAVTSIVCATALVISVYPGVLNDVLLVGVFMSFVVVPAGVVAVVVTAIVLARMGTLKRLQVPRAQVVVAGTMLFVTFVLLRYYVPRRIAFATSRADFEALIPQAPVSDFNGARLDRRLGLYNVEEYAADPRGGVYFHVYSGADGLGPNRTAYGFAFQPNLEGTPFGAADYRTFKLDDGWHWFCASDDWY